MKKGKRHSYRYPVVLLCLLVLLASVTVTGCSKVRSLWPWGHKAATTGGERLVAYELGGDIWTIGATGEGAKRISKTGGLMLGPWAPDAASLAVMSAVSQNGEWVTGNAGVLDLSGNLKPVLGPKGAISIEPGEISWLNAQSLVVGVPDTIWIARLENNQYLATALYTAKSANNEKVWHPRAVPGGAYVSFWITSTSGNGGDVKASLVTMPVAGGKPVELFSANILASGQAPVDALWSPDARYVLVYAYPAAGGNPWWLLDRTKGTKQQVLSANAGDPQWLPGDRLVYAPQAQLQAPGYAVLDPAAGASKPFVAIPNWTTWLQVGPDNRLLLAKATADNSISFDYYVAAADGSGAKLIVSGAGGAAWQP